jgi:Domain of unknown function (DUF4123)
MGGHTRNLTVPPADLRKLVAGRRLFAVLDPCDAPLIRAKVESLGPALAVCLHRGQPKPELREVAPYLVTVDDGLLDWLVASVWTAPWGIFVAADSDLGALRKHLRKFLVVKSPENEPMYFRFYDPRVISAFLASCSRQELDGFFGPVLAFGASGRALGEAYFLSREA